MQGDHVLPQEVLHHLATFLDTTDIFTYSRTCKQLKNDLGLSVLNFSTNLSKEWAASYHDGDTPRKDDMLPVFPLQHMTHSVMFSCLWKDQGWGNRKGKIFIVEEPNDPDGMEHTRHNLNDAAYYNKVAESGIAEHDETELRLFFHPQPNRKYYLWYRVGGGGGHELYLKSAHVKQVVYGDRTGHIATNFNILHSQNLFTGNDGVVGSFAIEMLLGVVQSLMNQIQTNQMLDSHLTVPLQVVGIELSLDSLQAIVTILKGTTGMDDFISSQIQAK
mmetsp:Transcript_7912/g.11410  ORF Transcript_7912/g.11410 Transcript_7912/m.11410 type:complete len:275 (-) Transcript_7912:1126-1950(-)